MSQDLRSLFLLDPEVVFLNHGSFGACPRPVFQTYQDWQLRLERQPVAFLDPERGYFNHLRDVRHRLAAFVGAGPDDLVGVTNATQGLNIALQSLPLREGDEILTTDHEYGALDKTLQVIARRSGAVIRRVTIPLPLASEGAFTDSLRAGITPRTRVLFLSHITSPTALLFPIGAIVAEARARGILTVIDGAHTPGHIPLDLTALGADVYSGNCHKWMMAPKGSGFLHVRPEMQTMIEPLVISHGWSADQAEPGPFGNTAFIDRLEMQGTRDPAAFLAVPAALDFAAAHGWGGIAARCRDLARDTAARMARATGLPPLSAPAFGAPQMVAMPVPRCDPLALKRRLITDHAIEIPVFDWQDHTIVRLSVQGYNTEAEMDLLVAALTGLLALGHAA